MFTRRRRPGQPRPRLGESGGSVPGGRRGGPDRRAEPLCGAAGAGRSGEPRDAPPPLRGPRCRRRRHHHQRRRLPAFLRPPQRPARGVSDPEGGRPSGRWPVRPPAAAPVPTGRREGHGRRVRPCPHRRRHDRWGRGFPRGLVLAWPERCRLGSGGFAPCLLSAPAPGREAAGLGGLSGKRPPPLRAALGGLKPSPRWGSGSGGRVSAALRERSGNRGFAPPLTVLLLLSALQPENKCQDSHRVSGTSFGKVGFKFLSCYSEQAWPKNWCVFFFLIGSGDFFGRFFFLLALLL